MKDSLLQVRGLVQGVGFRPLVWRLAQAFALTGWVRNDSQGVTIRIRGEFPPQWLERLHHEIPPLARIDQIEALTDFPADLPPCPPSGFLILDSAGGGTHTAIGPDAAICSACLHEISQPTGRRWRYAFTTCTHCGPRFTVSRGIPYDRARTTLSDFPLCPECAAEYQNPADRRFHAETTCCPACGPQLRLLDAQGVPVPGDPLAEALSHVLAGKIVAIKGLGGFHLACDARNAAAVETLRLRKSREAKPFAVMGLNVASLAGLVELDPADVRQLQHSAAPIVVCPQLGQVLAPAIAPGLNRLGVMLPSTPLHYLLWHEFAGSPVDAAWSSQVSDLFLVMTSANPQGEPLVYDNDEALRRLGGLADSFLLHNRDIVMPCDDSVAESSLLGGGFIRRARGYVPLPLSLPFKAENTESTVLAVGGDLKNTLCVLHEGRAYLSQHIGSLDNAATVAFHESTRDHLLNILDAAPALLVHDLHPDYRSVDLAIRWVGEKGIPTLAVQHHHAHLAAVCAEHGLSGQQLGWAIDGTGLGADGSTWGGELLLVQGQRCERLGHVQPIALPGGDRAAREPWRMAVAALHQVGEAQEAENILSSFYPQRQIGALRSLLERGRNCPPCTSLGRWFDAIAGLLGICEVQAFEGQAAMLLEGLAERHIAQHGLPVSGPLPWVEGVLQMTDVLPELLRLAKHGRPEAQAEAAARFHIALGRGLADMAIEIARRLGLSQVLVAGGCALNTVLMQVMRTRLAENGLTLLEAQEIPPNDGGLALGQAWIAWHALQQGSVNPG